MKRMTTQRMIELLEIEHECMLRGSHDDCDRDCANCELVQDDGDLHEMYTNVIYLLKEQEAVKPEREHSGGGTTWWNVCGNCKTAINPNDKFCHECGQKVKWE